LERQLTDLHIAHNNVHNELVQTREELENVQGVLEHANAMLATHDAQHLLEQEGEHGEGEAPDSDMDTEEDMPPLPAPPSPMGSEATDNNLDDF
ncbi:hypothetical protein, partial [Shigella flexneri]|uniref:hypothetical protein n=1 Tax=Shigella flexneri TaxID=623 RepID=UPI001C0A813D